ncbi:hypothetical protein AOL_s00083g505 [Orbilia oligospora ATCC 24927]|uniref:SWIRM domain-containing protein n=2 Tax=Orbilia oligospora TaxID=2813651 RepID=G1XHM4_ARTOA|nr:hypothetical protein AOL_s00083g505 [Orbilia oligospora ATCC 24927]EGX47412.1 hypothetical protein AOL_s00083g505 [Orbilia oligospora ATCC 24927]
MELDPPVQLVQENINPANQMPRTPESSPFKRPAMSFSPRPEISGFHEISHSDKKSLSQSGILSPPLSPYINRQISEVPSDLGPSILNRDPVLYDAPSNDENQRPLFDLSETDRESPASLVKTTPTRIVGVSAAKADSKVVSIPTFKSTAWQDCFRGPGEYFQRERQFLKQQIDAARAAKVVRAAKTVKLVAHSMSPKATISGPKRSHQRSRSSGSDIAAFPNDKVRIHRNTDNKVIKPKFSRQSKPVTTTRKDVHFLTVEDVTPLVDLLPDNPRCLHVDWSGAPLDISNDPDRHLLHKAEQHLASTLKLSCGQYLTQKRLIFLERVTRLRAGNQVFSRTHAQQVCHIDVNKASRLFAAFEKVGWLSPQALKQYL